MNRCCRHVLVGPQHISIVVETDGATFSTETYVLHVRNEVLPGETIVQQSSVLKHFWTFGRQESKSR